MEWGTLEGRRTNSRADVTRAEGLDGQVWVDFANDLGGIAVCEVGVLRERLSVSVSNHG